MPCIPQSHATLCAEIAQLRQTAAEFSHECCELRAENERLSGELNDVKTDLTEHKQLVAVSRKQARELAKAWQNAATYSVTCGCQFCKFARAILAEDTPKEPEHLYVVLKGDHTSPDTVFVELETEIGKSVGDVDMETRSDGFTYLGPFVRAAKHVEKGGR